MLEHECPECEFSTDSAHGLSSHRSQVHDVSFTVDVECNICGDVTEKQRSEIKRTSTNLCSEECKAELFSQREQSEMLIEKRIAPQREKVEVTCDYCGNEFLRTPKRVEKHDHQYCDFECKSQHQSVTYAREKHPRWSGGVSGIDFIRKHIGDVCWKEKAESIREKFDHECQMCGLISEENDKSLDVHHIVPITSGGTNEEELLIPLCLNCHRSAESYTQRIVENHLIE